MTPTPAETAERLARVPGRTHAEDVVRRDVLDVEQLLQLVAAPAVHDDDVIVAPHGQGLIALVEAEGHDLELLRQVELQLVVAIDARPMRPRLLARDRL